MVGERASQTGATDGTGKARIGPLVAGNYELVLKLDRNGTFLGDSGMSFSVSGEAEKLLEVPPEVCSGLTNFTTTPEPIHQHRVRLAAAIERLRGF